MGKRQMPYNPTTAGMIPAVLDELGVQVLTAVK
jgi:hypothetical protein